ncbi:hypothetical protein M427DRAFT_44944 [Gonapodya prolifera JEL478]|uniref:Uncharacterized protein n=1 Tax=Gonapodya prolifera (strain JEL478) TaxID=1344416 RepID=A0A139ACW1_GONPJ|nr:hypothetical protein M427DRAFT_44944 [Gonapodya prolifera JEL478]|eukprot:KXS14509.1 hypothetical protein M427DRAFT_44944 [Gonapodya prolifera JEL478]
MLSNATPPISAEASIGAADGMQPKLQFMRRFHVLECKRAEKGDSPTVVEVNQRHRAWSLSPPSCQSSPPQSVHCIPTHWHVDEIGVGQSLAQHILDLTATTIGIPLKACILRVTVITCGADPLSAMTTLQRHLLANRICILAPQRDLACSGPQGGYGQIPGLSTISSPTLPLCILSVVTPVHGPYKLYSEPAVWGRTGPSFTAKVKELHWDTLGWCDKTTELDPYFSIFCDANLLPLPMIGLRDNLFCNLVEYGTPMRNLKLSALGAKLGKIFPSVRLVQLSLTITAATAYLPHLQEDAAASLSSSHSKMWRGFLERLGAQSVLISWTGSCTAGIKDGSNILRAFAQSVCSDVKNAGILITWQGPGGTGPGLLEDTPWFMWWSDDIGVEE